MLLSQLLKSLALILDQLILGFLKSLQAKLQGIIYKATKLPKITPASFIKETALLFGSIVAIIILASLSLYIFAWLATE